MKIGIIGAGRIGLAIADLANRHGHDVLLGSRRSIESDFPAVSYREALEGSDIAFFCVPWEHAEEASSRIGDSVPGILIDCSNPETPDGKSLQVGLDDSGAETLARRLPKVSVIKAFNHLYADLLLDPVRLNTISPSIFFCGGSHESREPFLRFLESCALEGIDCGGLDSARMLEPLAILTVRLVRDLGHRATDTALVLSRFPARGFSDE